MISPSVMLTTTDNVYNPHIDYGLWHMEDMRLGHNTPGLLSRITKSTDYLDDGEVEHGMTELMRYDVTGKVVMLVEVSSSYDFKDVSVTPASHLIPQHNDKSSDVKYYVYSGTGYPLDNI